MEAQSSYMVPAMAVDHAQQAGERISPKVHHLGLGIVCQPVAGLTQPGAQIDIFTVSVEPFGEAANLQGGITAQAAASTHQKGSVPQGRGPLGLAPKMSTPPIRQ